MNKEEFFDDSVIVTSKLRHSDFISREFLEPFYRHIVIVRLKNGFSTTGKIIRLSESNILLEHKAGTLTALAISELVDVRMVN